MQFHVSILLIAFLQWNRESIGYFELVEELGCHDTEFRLICGNLDARIAIIEASFSQNDSVYQPMNATCGSDGSFTGKETWNVYRKNDTDNVYEKILKSRTGTFDVSFRHAINRRCSGVNYCSFILREDHAPAARWGSGTVYLRYVCMDDFHITKTCRADLNAELEGFVQTPGYPRYYIGDGVCSWTLRAQPTQTVRVKFLDIALRGTAPFEEECLDWLLVSEEGFSQLMTCGDIVEDTEIESMGPILNITLATKSKLLFPKRGLLFHYKAVGCPSPRKPKDGDLVARNGSLAHYRCDFGYVFPDTLSRDKILHCYNENTWNTDLQDCIRVEIAEPINSLESNYLKVYYKDGRRKMDDDSQMKDVIIPSIIMAALFIGNCLIVLIIFHYRKKLDFLDTGKLFMESGSDKERKGEEIALSLHDKSSKRY